MGEHADAATDGRERLLTGYRGRLLLLLSVGTTVVMTTRLALAPVLPRIIDDLGISPGLAGGALSVMWAMVALCRYPGGRLADRLSRKSVLVAGLVGTTAGATLVLVSDGYPSFLLAAAVLGIGIGLWLPAAVVSVSDLFVERRGGAYGVYEAFFNLAGVAAAGLALLVPAVLGWRDGYLALVVLLAVVTALLHRWSAEPYALGVPSLGLRETAARVFATRRVRRLVVAFALLAFANEGAIAFLPTLLQVEKGLAPALASNAFAAFFVVGMLVNPLAGGLGDRFGPLRVATAAGLVSATGVGLLVLAEGQATALVGVAVLAAGLTANWPVMLAYMMDAVPAESVGGDFGAVGTVFIAVGSLGPGYVGVVAERAGYAVAFAGLGVCLVAYAGVALWLAHTDGPGDVGH
ncbi:MAG: MFS transporter [Haloarculaceae archaeon]